MTWERVPFMDAFQSVPDRGRRVRQKQYLPSGALPVVDQGQNRVGGFTNDLDMKVKCELPLLVFGDHTRRVKYVDFDFAVGADGVKLLKPKALIEPRFAYWYLTSLRLPDRGYGRHFALLRGLDVPVPPLDEQARIVAILEDHLSHLDTADEYLLTTLRRAEAIGLSMLSHARRRLDAVEVKTIGAIAETQLGKMLDSKTQTGEPTPYLRNINVRWGAFDLDDLQETPMTDRDRARFDARDGDIFACEGGEPGRCAVWHGQGQGQGLSFQKAIHRLRVRDRSEISPEFLALMLTEVVRSGRADRLFTGTTIKHLPQEKLRNISVPVPDRDTQAAIVAELSQQAESVSRLRSTIHAHQRYSAVLRRSLLAAAFSGKLTGSAAEISEDAEMIDA